MKAYIYIEVFEDGSITLMFYPTSEDGAKPELITNYRSWDRLIDDGYFQWEIPVHISPDLLSDAGQVNSDWQRDNL